MKIVVDARELNGTGTGTYLKHLLSNLQEIDDENKYVILLKPQDMSEWHPTNSNFSKQVCPYKEFTFGEQLGFWLQLRKLKADLTHFPMPQQPILYRRRIVTNIFDLTTIRFRNPTKNWLVFTVKQQIYKWLIKYVARKSVGVITISDFTKLDVAQFGKISTQKIITTYPAADKISKKPQPLVKLKGQDFLLYIGRPLPHKNLVRLIDAYEICQRTQTDLLLVLVGKFDNNYKKLQEYVQKRGVRGVIFTDFMPDSNLRWLYENAKAYVFPSLSEGFGLPGLEAMLYDLPVVSSNATCLPEIYKDAALYFDPLSTADIAQKINQILNDPQLAQSLKQKGRQVTASYSWQKMAEQTLAVYNKALNK